MAGNDDKQGRVRRNAKGQFLPGSVPNPKGRPPGARDRFTVINEAVQRVFGGLGSAGFWEHLAKLAKAGDLRAASLLAERVSPPLKSEAMPISLALEGEPRDIAQTVLSAAGEGSIPVDHARALLAGLRDVVELSELEELQRRLDELEDQAR
jgi:hypothetical protein